MTGEDENKQGSKNPPEWLQHGNQSITEAMHSAKMHLLKAFHLQKN